MEASNERLPMTVTEFFEYLHDHPATTSLAETMAAVLGGRRRPELVPITVPTRDRVAS